MSSNRQLQKPQTSRSTRTTPLPTYSEAVSLNDDCARPDVVIPIDRQSYPLTPLPRAHVQYNLSRVEYDTHVQHSSRQNDPAIATTSITGMARPTASGGQRQRDRSRGRRCFFVSSRRQRGQCILLMILVSIIAICVATAVAVVEEGKRHPDQEAYHLVRY